MQKEKRVEPRAEPWNPKSRRKDTEDLPVADMGKKTHRGDKKSVIACNESDGQAKIKEEEGGGLQSDLE